MDDPSADNRCHRPEEGAFTHVPVRSVGHRCLGRSRRLVPAGTSAALRRTDRAHYRPAGMGWVPSPTLPFVHVIRYLPLTDNQAVIDAVHGLRPLLPAVFPLPAGLPRAPLG